MDQRGVIPQRELGERGGALQEEVGVGEEESTEKTRTLTLEQVGQIIGVTKERVRQIQNKALQKIRDALEEVTPRESPKISAN